MGFYAIDGDKRGEVVLTTNKDKIIVTSNANKYGNASETDRLEFDTENVCFRCTACGDWFFLDDVCEGYSTVSYFFYAFLGKSRVYIGFNWFEVKDGRLFADLSGSGVSICCCETCRLLMDLTGD